MIEYLPYLTSHLSCYEGRMVKTLSRLPRTVWLIGLMSLVNDCASEMLYPLIPLYLSAVLMAGPQVLGLIEGLADMTASLLKLVSGIIVDRTQRTKPWIILGYSLAGVGRPVIAFIQSWPWLLVIRVTDRIGKGLRTSPRDALIAQSVAPGYRGLAFGLHRSLDNAGSVIGPVLSFVLLANHVSMPAVFLWSAVPALLCVVLSFGINEAPIQKEAQTGPAVRYEWRLKRLPSEFLRFLVVQFVFNLGKASSLFLLLRAKDLGVDPARIPLLWAAVSAVATLFSVPLSSLSDRWGRRNLLAGGYLGFGICYALMAGINTQGPGLFALFMFYGLCIAATEGAERAVVADLAAANARGAAFGWYYLVTGVTFLPASFGFGALYEHVSAKSAFLASATCVSLAAVLLFRWLQLSQIKPQGERQLPDRQQ